MMNVDKNTGISIGLALSIIGAVIFCVTRFTEIETRLSIHVENKSLHHNIIIKMERDFVKKETFEFRMKAQGEKLTDIKNDLRAIKKHFKIPSQ